MKLLASDPKPRAKSGSGPANFTSSSSTAAAAPPRKRTRELPNLFDCHCCGRHINRDNPRDRPQALESLWRIVLLCNKCRKTVRSGKKCSYCFRETGNSEDHCECSMCGRKIHKDCVKRYGDCSPWCYLGVGLELEEFGVCVDCWVPDMLKTSTRVSRSNNKRRLKNRAVGKRLLVKNAERENEASRRRKVMENVANLENDELDSLRKKDESVNSVAIEVSDLVSQSRGNVNNLVNYGSPDALNIKGFNNLGDEKSGLGKDGGGDEKFGLCANDADSERKGKYRSDPYNNFGRFGRGLLSYRRTRFRQKACQENGSHDTSEGSTGANDVNGMYARLEPYKQDRGQKNWLYKQERGQKKCLLSDENAVASEGSHHKSNAGVSQGCGVGVVYDRFGTKLVYERDRWRKNWRIDDGHNVVFDKFGRELLCYKRTRFREKACELNGLVDVNGVRNVDGSSPGLLTYKQENSRKRWQLYSWSPGLRYMRWE